MCVNGHMAVWYAITVAGTVSRNLHISEVGAIVIVLLDEETEAQRN